VFVDKEEGDGDHDAEDCSDAEATDIDTGDLDPQPSKAASQPVVVIPAQSQLEATAVDDDDDLPSAPAVPLGRKKSMSPGNALVNNDNDDLPSAQAVPLEGKESMSSGNALTDDDDDDDFPSAPAVPLGGKESTFPGNALANNVDDDFLSAPAIPLGGKKGISPGNALTESVNTMNLPPPSTAPNLGPVVQVKETPARRANSISNSPTNARPGNGLADDDDDDFPSAPAVPLGGKKGTSPGNTLGKSVKATNRPPPSTAPNLGPIVQVKETPARRANSTSNSPTNARPGNGLADDDDDDFPSAPAVPLGGKKGTSPGNTLGKSVKATNRPPPSTAPNLGPIVQVKETPACRANSTSNSPTNARIRFNKAYHAEGENRVPSTHQQPPSSLETSVREQPPSSLETSVHEQPTSSIETGVEVPATSSIPTGASVPDRQPTSFAHISPAPTTTSSAPKPPAAKAKPEIRKLKCADFASQEIHEASRNIDMSKLLEEQYRRFHNQPPKRPHPAVSRSTPPPPPAKKPRTSPPQSSFSRRLSAILRPEPPSPSILKQRPAVYIKIESDSEPDEIPLYEPPPPLEEGAGKIYTPAKKPMKRPQQPQQPPKAPPSAPTAKPKEALAANQPQKAENRKPLPAAKQKEAPAAKFEPPQKKVKRAEKAPAPRKADKGKAKEIPAEVPPPKKAEKRISKEKEPELYAGFRPRVLTFPGEETLSAEDKAELDRRRQAFYGTHEVKPWISTPGTDTTPFPPPPRATQRKGGGSEDMWWLDDAAPMRRFVGKFMQLRAVRRELGN
jgi:hypothetical protein